MSWYENEIPVSIQRFRYAPHRKYDSIYASVSLVSYTGGLENIDKDLFVVVAASEGLTITRARS